MATDTLAHHATCSQVTGGFNCDCGFVPPDDKPTYNCSSMGYHLPVCGGTCGVWKLDKPTVSEKRAHICGDPNDTCDQECVDMVTDKPAGGLTDDAIHHEFDVVLSAALPCCDVECPEDFCQHVRLIAARRIGAIVRMDCEFEGCDQEPALCVGHIVQDVREAKHQARKVERERVAGIAQAHVEHAEAGHVDTGCIWRSGTAQKIADAILWGEE